MPYCLQALEFIRRPFRRQEGQGLVEYALILVLVALVVIAALILLGNRIGGVFGTVNDSLDPAAIAATATALAGS
ncbi:MAG: Flp family type IVb pilin [Anaerolineae bacterium]|nr:Flp family type IVb pilin [Anaerolineae bacterium]